MKDDEWRGQKPYTMEREQPKPKRSTFGSRNRGRKLVASRIRWSPLWPQNAFQTVHFDYCHGQILLYDWSITLHNATSLVIRQLLRTSTISLSILIHLQTQNGKGTHSCHSWFRQFRWSVRFPALSKGLIGLA